MNASRHLPGARALAYLDALMAVWVAAWIGMGVAIGINVAHLTDLSHTVAADGNSVQSVGQALSSLRDVPFIGGTIAAAAAQISQAGASTAASAAGTASSVHTLAVLLAVAVALLPSVPVFGFYLPVRLHRRAEARRLAREWSAHGDDPRFRAFLANRALASLSYRQLGDTAAAWRDGDPERTDPERTDRLVAAELRRLGIDADARPRPPRGQRP